MAKITFALLGIFLSTLVSVFGQDFTTIVDVPALGKIQGNEVLTSKGSKAYYIFHGIPYADPNSYVGPGKRFRPSEVMRSPLTDDGSVFPADKLTVFCPQDALIDIPISKANDIAALLPAAKKTRRNIMQSFAKSKSLEDEEIPKTWGQEDCLTMNINMPKNPASPLSPVIFFIHGGGSNKLWGSAFTGLRLLEKDVVLVTINYRLGALGSFDLGVDAAPGCGAMYDAITALKFVQEYISHFGGDPNRVTIAGHSAGSMMVTHLMLSPLAKGLFHRVWGYSGSALNVWGTAENPSIRHHLDVAHYAKCYDRDSTPIENAELNVIAECMSNLPVDNLVHAMNLYEFQETSIGKMGFDARVPGIQSPTLSFDRFLSEDPTEILRQGKHNIVPLVLGATRHDGSFVINDIYYDYILPNELDKNETYIRNELVPEMLKSFGIKDDAGGLPHSLSRSYLGDTANTGDLESKIPGLIDIATVFGFKGGQYKMIEHNAKVEPNSYFYSMDYKGRWTLYEVLGSSDFIPGGIGHGDDMIYIFYLGPLLNDDMKVSNRMVDYLVNFAYTGNPTPEGTLAIGETPWPAYDPVDHKYLAINRVDKVRDQCPDSWVGASAELVRP